MPAVTPPREQSPGRLWDEPEVGPSSRYCMEERVYPEYRPCIGVRVMAWLTVRQDILEDQWGEVGELDEGEGIGGC